MGTKLAPLELELYRRVDEVLHYLWDPIGVAGVPEARDEYYSYLPPVFNMLREGASAEQITAYLEEITTAGMGLGANAAHSSKVAEVLLRWSKTQPPNPSFKRTPDGAA